MDENAWVAELESILQEDCNVEDIRLICQGKQLPEELRPMVWQVCLDARYSVDKLSAFNEIYDLPFQNKLREDCNILVDRVCTKDENKVSILYDLESILTYFWKSQTCQCDYDKCWIELLLPIVTFQLDRFKIYNIFAGICDTYVPKQCHAGGAVFHLFRLLILYHDPELCTMLDTKKVSPDLYATQWFKSLFASCCNSLVVLALWDLYFQYSDPFLIFFLSLTVLINSREQILAMREDTKTNIIEYLASMPCALEKDDIYDFFSLAQYYSVKTPSSFKKDFLTIFYGKHNASFVDKISCPISQTLCLPVSAYELLTNYSSESKHIGSIDFFLVDCRPLELYNQGHLSTAFHLDCNLMLQKREAFDEIIQNILSVQQSSVNSSTVGKHICFMGSGRMDEDQYAYVIVATFLQRNIQCVSWLTGGYLALHNFLEDKADSYFKSHDSTICPLCCKGRTELEIPKNTEQPNEKVCNKKEASSELFKKLSSVVKSKSVEVKDKLINFVVNSSSSNNAALNDVVNKPQFLRHVSASDYDGKRYRNVPSVFDNDNHNSDEICADSLAVNGKDIVNFNDFTTSPNILNVFKCQRLQANGSMHDVYLLITAIHLIVLRKLGNDKAKIIVRRPLASIVNITAKKRYRDLITFKFGFSSDGTVTITDIDRYIIPNSSEVTDILSKHIVQTLQDNTWDKLL